MICAEVIIVCYINVVFRHSVHIKIFHTDVMDV